MTTVNKKSARNNTVLVCDEPQFCADCDQLMSPLGVAEGPEEDILECTCPQCGMICLCSAQRA